MLSWIERQAGMAEASNDDSRNSPDSSSSPAPESKGGPAPASSESVRPPAAASEQMALARAPAPSELPRSKTSSAYDNTGHGIRVTQRFDEDGRVISTSFDFNPSPEPLRWWTVYDGTGRRLQAKEKRGGPAGGANQPADA